MIDPSFDLIICNNAWAYELLDFLTKTDNEMLDLYLRKQIVILSCQYWEVLNKFRSSLNELYYDFFDYKTDEIDELKRVFSGYFIEEDEK